MPLRSSNAVTSELTVMCFVGALWLSWKFVFPLHPLERQQTCLHHFDQNVTNVSAQLPAKLRVENTRLIYKWQQSDSVEALGVNKMSLMTFWAQKCEQQLPKLVSFFSFHERRQQHLVALYDAPFKTVMEMLMKPNNSLAETNFARIKAHGGYRLSVGAAARFQVVKAERQGQRAKARATAATGHGTCARGFERGERYVVSPQTFFGVPLICTSPGL